MDKEVLATIAVLGGRKTLGLFFTPERLIVASTRVSKRERFAQIGRKWYYLPFMFLGAFVAGFVGGSLAVEQQKLHIKKTQDLSNLTPENLLLANKENFAIPFNEITTLEFSKGKWGGASKVEINTSTAKSKYSIPTVVPKEKQLEDVNILRTVLGNKIISNLKM